MVNTKGIPLFSLPSMPNQEQPDALLHRLILEMIAHPPESPERTQKVEALMVLANYLPGILTNSALVKAINHFMMMLLR